MSSPGKVLRVASN